MMMFLNLMLLGGAAAAVVPLIIHLLNRTRFKTLDWGAMHLLESALKINSRRTQWQAWLLLLLRMLIPAILALCLARPVLTAWRTAAGGNQHSVVLLIDNSLSMEAESQRQLNVADEAATSSAPLEGSCFDVAIAEAATIIGRFGPATELTILTTGGGVVDQTSGATFDRARALRRLRDIRSGAGGSTMTEAISAGLTQLSRATQPRRHLILISDFQRSDWEEVPPEALATLRASADAVAPPVEITFIPVTPRSSENLSIQIDRPAGASVVAHHQPLEVRVTIRNHGRGRVKNLPVVLTADGDALASKTVEVAGDSQVFLVFTCQLQSLGSHLLSASIDEAAARKSAGEALRSVVTTDDVARWSVQVIEPVRLGIVSTRAADSSSIDDAMFLNLALSPYAVSLVGGSVNEETAGWAEAQAGADPIRCEMVSPDKLSERWLASMQAVALTNIPTLDPQAAQRLVDFVQAGGVLLVWGGDALQADWYNEHWGPTSPTALLPYQYGEISRPAGRTAVALKIQPKSYEHPALTLFNRSSNGRLDSIDFKTWFELVGSSNSPATTSGAKSVLDLLVLENGDRMLAERVVGRGRVYQWATSCGERWSNLPLREVFVPLMQQLVLHGVTAASPQLNLETGQTLAVTWYEESSKPENKDTAAEQPANAAATASAAATAAVQLLTPGGTRYRLEPQQSGDERSLQFSRTQFPGAYQLSGTEGQTTTVAIGARPEESMLLPLTQSSLSSVGQRLGALIEPSAEEFWRAEMVKQTGREVWRWMLMALVACLFAELLLQQSLTRTPV